MESNDFALCGKVIAKALASSRPTLSDRDYAELLQRMATDPAFREMVVSFTDGLGLMVLVCTEDHLIMTPTNGDSIFCVKLGRYRQKLGTGQDKIGTALVVLSQIAIASTLFPTSQDLDSGEPSIQTAATLTSIAELLLDTCRKVVSAEDSPEVTEGLRRACEVILGLPRSPEKKENGEIRGKKTAAVRTIDGALELILNHLVKQKCLDAIKTADGIDYMPTRKYAAMVQHRAIGGLYDILRDIQQANK